MVQLRALLDLGSYSLPVVIPSNLEKLVNLQKLNLTHNDLSGPTLAGLSHMPSLETFGFSYIRHAGEMS